MALSLLSKKTQETANPLTGIFGDSQDYHFYNMSVQEKLTGFALGLAGGFAMVWVVYNSIIAGLIVGVVLGILVQPIYKEYLTKKRHRELLLQFRDMLEALSASYGAGKNTPDAFADAKRDLEMQYSSKAEIVQEIGTILMGLEHNYTVETMLSDLAKRTGIQDIESFSSIFVIANRMGGNISEIIGETRSIISQKMEIEMEIQTMISETQNQLKVMVAMPFVIILMLRTMGSSNLVDNSPVNLMVKTIAILVFFGAYRLGQRITRIKV